MPVPTRATRVLSKSDVYVLRGGRSAIAEFELFDDGESDVIAIPLFDFQNGMATPVDRLRADRTYTLDWHFTTVKVEGTKLHGLAMTRKPLGVLVAPAAVPDPRDDEHRWSDHPPFLSFAQTLRVACFAGIGVAVVGLVAMALFALVFFIAR